MHSVVHPNAWVALKLPSENVRVLQVEPNTTISLGKYGTFPSNLIIHRPYYLTFEIQDKKDGEDFSRLRVVPASELHAEAIADEATPTASRDESATPDESEAIISAQDSVEYSLVDADSDTIIAISSREVIDDNARQTLTKAEIEKLKLDGVGAGKDLITKLLLSHTALDQKTAFSLAKYKLLKTKKYIRRFSVLPLDLSQLIKFLLEDKDVGNKTLELREEITALLGCWANIHYGGDDVFCRAPLEQGDGAPDLQLPEDFELQSGRYLAVDDASGLLVASMAERMGILYPNDDECESAGAGNMTAASNGHADPEDAYAKINETQRRKDIPRPSDFQVLYSLTNTITVLHTNSQTALPYLTYFGFDSTIPDHPPHPLNTHLLPLTWLQLLHPEDDGVYTSEPPVISAEDLATWKATRRGNYHRKRRRWTRTRHIVDSTRAGGFSGLAVASTMDPASILRHTLHLLAGGAPIAIYSPSIEPLSALVDCFSVARRSAWTAAEPPPEIVGKTAEELERWEGSPDFPVNPTLVLGASVQTSRARKWQALPGRTHPLMTARGGSEGFVFTAWRARPVEGRVAARGNFKRRKTGPSTAAVVDGTA